MTARPVWTSSHWYFFGFIIWTPVKLWRWKVVFAFELRNPSNPATVPLRNMYACKPEFYQFPISMLYAIFPANMFLQILKVNGMMLTVQRRLILMISARMMIVSTRLQTKTAKLRTRFKKSLLWTWAMLASQACFKNSFQNSHVE